MNHRSDYYADEGEEISSLRSITSFLTKIIATVGGVFVIVLVVTLLIARPTGETRFVVAAQNPPDWLNVTVFPDADTSIKDAFAAHEELSERIVGQQIDPLPQPNITDEPSSFRAIVESLGLELKFEDETGQAVGRLNLVVFFETLYSALGFTDYFVTVTLIEPDTCADPLSDEECFRMNVRYKPALIPSETMRGTPASLAEDLAVYVMRGIVQKHGDAWRAQSVKEQNSSPPFLFAVNTPNSMSRLNAALNGLKILSDGCEVGVQRRQCLEEARGSLKQARGDLANDREGNPVIAFPPAAFGLAALELGDAIRHAKQGRSAVAIERNLGAMGGFIKEARLSRFLKSALEKNGLKGYGFLFGNDIEIDPKLFAGVEGTDFACALAYHRRAKWTDCLERTERVDLLPAALRPHFQAARFDARLYNPETDEVAKRATLDELRQAIEATDSALAAITDWPLRLVEFRHLCRSGLADDAHLNLRGNELLVGIQSNQRRSLVELIIRQCKGEDSAEESEQLIAELKRSFDSGPDSFEKRILHLEIARYWALEGDLERAVGEARLARSLPWFRLALIFHPDFRLIADDLASMQQLLNAPIDPLANTDLEICSDWET